MADTALKSRHGCLTAYLIFMMVANAATAVFYIFAGDQVRQALPGAPQWMIWALGALAVLNLIFAIALFTWKKWGFWGFVGTSVLAIGANIAVGLGVAQSLVGLLGVAILFGVLQIGDKNKGWPQLE